MELQTLKAKTRATSGKGEANKLRHAGILPGVLYGGGQPPVSLNLDRHQFDMLVQHSRSGEHAIIKLEIEDNAELNTPALLKAVQHHPVRREVLHADFLRIRLDERITTMVPIRLAGQAPGIAEGGVIDQPLREMEVECLALEVPDEIVVDISGMHMGDSIHVEHVAPLPNVTFVTDPDRPIVAIHAPRAVKEEAPAAEGEAAEGEAAPAEPEVITERKDRDKDKEKEKD